MIWFRYFLCSWNHRNFTTGIGTNTSSTDLGRNLKMMIYMLFHHDSTYFKIYDSPTVMSFLLSVKHSPAPEFFYRITIIKSKWKVCKMFIFCFILYWPPPPLELCIYSFSRWNSFCTWLLNNNSADASVVECGVIVNENKNLLTLIWSVSFPIDFHLTSLNGQTVHST